MVIIYKLIGCFNAILFVCILYIRYYEKGWLNLMREVTQNDVDNLVRSLLNYYWLSKCGIIHDSNVGPDFLKAIKEISKRGPELFDNIK